LGIIIPTDELIFFRGVGIPPTRYSIFFRLSMILEKGGLIILGFFFDQV